MAFMQTRVDIAGDRFLINGQPTYEGRSFRGRSIEGLLLNSRMVQGVFDDRNPETRSRWNYPDGPWDPERNTREFTKAMPAWRKAGLLAFDVNFQGGSPQGYSATQPWENSAFTATGSLRAGYADRMKQIIDRADELGMAVMLGFFYFGQDHRLDDERAVVRAVDEATDWILDQGYSNVIVEIANEVNVRKYVHEIIKPHRCHELIARVQGRSAGKVDNAAGRLLTGTSFGGGFIPTENVAAVSDVIMPHGNGVGERFIGDPAKLRKMIAEVRAVPTYRGQPIVYNEDDHFEFDEEDNHFVAAVGEGVSWGFFDFRIGDEGYDEGYQSVPVNWGISSDRKRGFFRLLAEITGGECAE